MFTALLTNLSEAITSYKALNVANWLDRRLDTLSNDTDRILEDLRDFYTHPITTRVLLGLAILGLTVGFAITLIFYSAFRLAEHLLTWLASLSQVEEWDVELTEDEVLEEEGADWTLAAFVEAYNQINGQGEFDDDTSHDEATVSWDLVEDVSRILANLPNKLTDEQVANFKTQAEAVADRILGVDFGDTQLDGIGLEDI